MSYQKIAGRWGTRYQVDGIRIDPSTSVLTTIENAHHEIHDGSAFTAFFENMVTASAEMTVIAFNTPDTTKFIHMLYFGSSTAIARMAIYENPSIDLDEGGNFEILNLNRNSAKKSGLLSLETLPVPNRVTTFDETQAAGAKITKSMPLASLVVGAGGVGNSSVGGSAGGRLEFILKKNQQYAFVIEGLDATNNYHTVRLDWYEHTDKHG